MKKWIYFALVIAITIMVTQNIFADNKAGPTYNECIQKVNLNRLQHDNYLVKLSTFANINDLFCCGHFEGKRLDCLKENASQLQKLNDILYKVYSKILSPFCSQKCESLLSLQQQEDCWKGFGTSIGKSQEEYELEVSENKIEYLKCELNYFGKLYTKNIEGILKEIYSCSK